MSKAQQIKDKYDDMKAAELKALRASCKHEFVGGWEQHYYSFNHPSSFCVQNCRDCEQEMHRKTWCSECEREIIDDAILEGDGLSGRAGGAYYCAVCFASCKAS